MPEGYDAARTTEQVAFSENRFLSFKPRNAPETFSTGLILYPGGLVPPRAYAPLARELAAAGYPVWLVPMPLHLAVLGSGRAAEIIQQYPAISHWVVGGHSLGGAMAARFAAQDEYPVKGLVLLASYPSESDSLRGENLPVLSIYGSEDGLASPDVIRQHSARLPEDTVYLELQGGNHAQFGWYGQQDGDGQAKISRESQQQQIVTGITWFLQSLEVNQ